MAFMTFNYTDKTGNNYVFRNNFSYLNRKIS